MSRFILLIYFQTNGTPAADQATGPVWLDTLKTWSGYLATGVEVCAALIIGIAAIEAFITTLLVFVRRQSPPEAKENLRLRLGRWLAVALEFGLAADILRTAVAPSWNEIGQLVVIAFLRTALNYFLQKEIDRATLRDSSTPTQQFSPVSGVTRAESGERFGNIAPTNKSNLLTRQGMKSTNPGAGSE